MTSSILAMVAACSPGEGQISQPCIGSNLHEAKAPLAAFCGRTMQYPCTDWSSKEQCVELIESRLPTLPGCCGDELAALLRCGTSAGMRCGNLGDLLFTTACSAAEEAFDACTGAHDNCTIEIHSDGSCKFECDQYAAMCSRVDAGSSCQCTYGPRNGTQFESCDEDAVRAHCK